jgi:hypothetical protein
MKHRTVLRRPTKDALGGLSDAPGGNVASPALAAKRGVTAVCLAGDVRANARGPSDHARLGP